MMYEMMDCPYEIDRHNSRHCSTPGLFLVCKGHERESGSFIDKPFVAFRVPRSKIVG